MKKTIITILAATFLISALFSEIKAQRLIENKELFTKGYPMTLSFRNDRFGLKEGYGYWEKVYLPFNGITKKYLREEVSMPPEIAAWANRYAQEHPEKLMLLHLNGEARSVNDPKMHKLYFPGHWVYEEGTTPLEDIDRNQKVIRVQTAKPFSEHAYTIHGKNAKAEKLPHDLIIVEVDEKGNRIWDQSEFATIEKVDYKTNTIVLKRGQYRTEPRNFKKGRTYIAPVAGDSWGGNLMWYYNLSACCPLDKNGNSAADVFVNEMKNWFGPSGILRNIDGIGFDVNYFETDHQRWDCNNDGKADRGFIDGKNVWRLGDIEFLQKIRDIFGDEFIITSDGWRDEMQRAVGILNGMETEGLCRPNDGYRQISRTINQQTYWKMYDNAKYQFSYITSKLRNPLDERISTQLHRMGMALASCLEVAYAYPAPLFIPEAVGGALNKINWLGKPVSELKYTAKETPDLLNGAGAVFSQAFIDQFDFSGADHFVNGNELHIKGKKDNVYEEQVIPGPEIHIPSGDLVVFFEAKAVQGFADLGNNNRIPRKINIRIEGLPEYPVEPMNTQRLYNQLSGFMGTAGFTPQMFYFRNAGGTGNPLRIVFEAEEQGEFVIRNLSVHNAPATMVRQFENGLVLVNPSLQACDFNLKSLYPQLTSYRRIKIDRSKTENLDGNLRDVSSYNNGEKIKNASEVTVPALNALFLTKSE